MELQDHYSEISSAGAEVLAVSTDKLEGAETSVRRFGAEFPILYTALDPSVPKSYGVFNLHGDRLASASVFIIDTDGVVRWQSIGRVSSHQVAADTIIDQVRQIRG